MAQFKVVITDFGLPDNELERVELEKSGLDIELVRLNASSAQDLLPHIKDADALIVQWANISREVIVQLDKCKVISRYGIGVDMIDLVAASERGIMVCNVPDYCIEEVCTHTLGFLLMLNRRLLDQHQHTLAGNWGRPPGRTPARLSSQIAGIIGMGNIGLEVVKRTQCFGMRVLVYDPYLSAEEVAAVGAEHVNLETLLQNSDYICVHCPLTEGTHHLIGESQLKIMKSSAYLINLARGPVVDQSALYMALANETIAGAALDVFETEPLTPDNPLLQLENILFSPHLSSWSVDSGIQLRRDVARNVTIALKGEYPSSVVNRKALN